MKGHIRTYLGCNRGDIFITQPGKLDRVGDGKLDHIIQYKLDKIMIDFAYSIHCFRKTLVLFYAGGSDMVLIGNLSLLPQSKEIFPALEKLYNVRFHIPKYSQFCTAIGAALAYEKK